MDFFAVKYTLFIIPALIIGYIADLIIGDPHGVWHPVCFIGRMITLFERGLRRIFSCPAADSKGKRMLRDVGESVDNELLNEADESACNRLSGEKESSGMFRTERRNSLAVREFIAGLFLVILVLFCTLALTFLLLLICYRIHWAAGLILQSYMSYTILATKSLRVESMKVYAALKEEGLEAGRQAVSMIVGRDTERLDEPGVTKAAVETVAENTSDGVIAPLIFLVIGGPILGYFYKAVNTMDSMVGYQNERYRHFGTAAARFDDVLNYLPARISAVLMITAAAIFSAAGRIRKLKTCGKADISREKTKAQYIKDDFMNAKNARKIWKRDRRNHASPNSAQTEAVMAGALGIQLAGDAWYFGVKHEKQTIGDALRPVDAGDIVRANRLMYATSILALVVFLFVRWILMIVFHVL